jgi:MerR family redox-sensitive transcriptional activator SoxR
MTTALTVSEVARESGVNRSAIRFYEAQGLISAERTAGNQRRFGKETACRVKAARVAQRIGLTIDEIRDILDDLPADPALEDWELLHKRLAEEATHRIAELAAALKDIASGKLCEVPAQAEPIAARRSWAVG